MSELYEIFNREKFDNQKKTIVAFMLDVPLKKETYNVTTGYFFNTLRLLHKDFNILLISRNTGTNWIEMALENDNVKDYVFLCFDTKYKTYYSANAKEQSHDEKVEYILKGIKEIEQNEPKIMNSLVATIMTHTVLPSLDLNFEILSYGNPELLKKQKKSSEGYISRVKRHKLVSHTAFIYKPVGFGFEFLFYLMEHYPNLQHYGFSHDSSSTWLQFTKQYNPYTQNVKAFYYVEQKFENREFEWYPMCEMQDFLNKPFYDKDHYENILNNKKQDFLFGGLFPYKVPQRVDAWYKYFDKLNVNGVIRTQLDGKTKIDQRGFTKETEFTDPIAIKLNEDMRKHPLITNTLPYDEYNEDLKNSLFTMCVSCYYGKYDNLTFRFIGGLHFGTITLLAEEYDPHCLQIPKKFRDKLVVRNNKEIEEKCNYYRTHYDEYKELFYELYDYFVKPKYFTDAYYEHEFKTNFFKEIY